MIRLLPLAALMVLAACGSPPELAVDDAWVRLPAVQGNPGAAYFTVAGGPADAEIVSVTSDVSLRSEMHESMAAAGGPMTMRPLQRVKVPASGKVVFAPGGRHVMLFGINPGIVRGGRPVLLTLTFADGTRISRKAKVFGAGDPAPE